MNNSKRQTLALIGIVLLVVAGILIYAGLSQPRVYEAVNVTPELNSVEAEAVTVISNNTSVSYPVNLNTATYDELVSIDGIGEVRADQILQYREEIGAYSSVEQIMDIKGIGESVYYQAAPYLTV